MRLVCLSVFCATVLAGGVSLANKEVDSVDGRGIQTVLFEPQEEWSAPLWLVTHVDLHRTTKVQAFLKFLKEDAKSW